MKSLVVFFALAAVACGSYIPLAQPAHHPALVLDPHGRPLDTAEVINARAIHLQAKALETVGHAAYAPLAHAAVVAPVAHAAVVAPAVVAAPAAVSHQSRVDVRTSPAIVAHAAPVYGAHAIASPLLGHSAYGIGHLLKKRSLGHIAYSTPIIAPAAVSHQSRVDVVSSPAVVSHAVAAPVLAHAVAAPVVAHAIAPAAVSHQSRVDIRTSPAIVAHAAPIVAHAAPIVAHAAPIYGAHAIASPLLGHSAHGLGHLLKKRSLGHIAYSAPIIAPAAVSHQSRVDVVSSPVVVSHAVAVPVHAQAVAAPVVGHSIAPAAVSHQSRVDIRTSPAIVAAHAAPIVAAAPVAHAAVVAAPAAVSHQSRVDVRTSPAITVAAVAPVAHSVVAASSLLSAAHIAHAGPIAHGW